ncbi:hypothetical protein JXA84_08315 [candidate division WOR-3 bacterium]|nr:hypothetical protein [candidate division WOR-3 bacterium]
MRFPVCDFPFNTENGFSFSSMNQSIALTSGLTQGVHQSLKLLWSPDLSDKKFVSLFSNRRFAGLCISITLFDIFSPFKGWTHEEGHRAVLSMRGISSQNDIYLNPFAEMVSVSHVRDEDLIRLKDEFPEDMVRLAEAGGEVQIELSMQMRKQNFFGGRSTIYDVTDIWINLGNLAWYVWLCGSDMANRIIEEETLKEDTDIMKRDIIGGDYLSWVYDLFRPDEPYLSGLRGRPHPSGKGIDRYIMPSELSDEELGYLRLQNRLILLNFISPQIFGIDRFAGTSPFNKNKFYWNLAVTHHLTSFGTATGLHFFYQQGKFDIVLSLLGYASKRTFCPGFSLELYRYPVILRGMNFSFSSTASLWLQPTDQRFLSESAQAGGSVMLGVVCHVRDWFEVFTECDIKTEGWLAGNVYLEPALQTRAGFSVTVK